MLLEDKNAIIYGAGGAIGGAVARAFAREGARVFLTGRNLASVEVVFGLHAKAMGIPREQFLAFVESMTHRKRSSTLAEVANTAVFLASDKASGMIVD